MNRKNREAENRSAYSKVEHCKRKRSEEQTAEDVLKQALAECMQEEAKRTEKKIETEGQHAFSKSFIEKMQFVLKQGRAAEEQEKKKMRGRRWIGLRGSFQMSQNETSGSAAKTEIAGKEECLEIGTADQGEAASGNVDDSDVQKDGAAISDQGKEENESSQDSMSAEENTSASTGLLTQKVDVKVLAVTPTSLQVRLTNNGDEDICFGDDYEKIEVYDKATDTWTECPKLDELAYYDILHVVKPGDEQNWYDWYVDWTEVYGSLEEGHYRLQKDISIGNIDGGDQYVQSIQIAFDVR